MKLVQLIKCLNEISENQVCAKKLLYFAHSLFYFGIGMQVSMNGPLMVNLSYCAVDQFQEDQRLNT